MAILVSAVASVIIAIPGVFFAPQMLRMVQAPESVILLGTPYVQVSWGSTILIILLSVLNGVFRGAGDALLALKTFT